MFGSMAVIRPLTSILMNILHHINIEFEYLTVSVEATASKSE